MSRFPSLSDSYEVFKLPRISNIPAADRCVIADRYGNRVSDSTASNSSAGKSFLHIAISASSISTYVLAPSPKLVWSHSLPPSAHVKHLSVFEDHSNSLIYFAACITIRDQHYLKLIVNESLLKAPSASNSISNSTMSQDDKANESESSSSNQSTNISQITSIELPCAAVLSSFNKGANFLYYLLEDGTIRFHSLSNLSSELPAPEEYQSNQKLSHSIIFAKSISNDSTASSTLNKDDGAWYIIKRNIHNGDCISCVYKFNQDKVIEISSFSKYKLFNIEDLTSDEKKGIYSFAYAANMFYVMDANQQNVTWYAQSDNELKGKMDLRKLFAIHGIESNEEYSKEINIKHQPKNVGIVCPAPNRLLLTIEDTVYLINLKFGSILESYKLFSDYEKQHGNTDSNENCYLLNAELVKGTSAKNCTTTLNYLILDGNDRNYRLKNMAVNVGNNSLSESLNKGVEAYYRKIEGNKSKQVNGNIEDSPTSNVKIINGEKLVYEMLIDVRENVGANEASKGEIFNFEVLDSESISKVEDLVKTLKELAKNQKCAQFDYEFINFMKAKEVKMDKIERIYAHIDTMKNDKSNNLDFINKTTEEVNKLMSKKNETEVSNELYKVVLDMVFTYSGTDRQIKFKNDDFIPQLSCIFLINSSLFPPLYSLNGLLSNLMGEPMILNFAISNYNLHISIEDVLLLMSEIIDNEEEEENDNVDDDDIEEMKNVRSKNDSLLKRLIDILIMTKSEQQIVKCVKSMLSSSEKRYRLFNDSFSVIIFRIVDMNYGLRLLNLIIDGIGLMNFKFNNDEESINKLLKFTEVKIHEIMKFEPIEGLLNEIIESHEAVSSNNDKKDVSNNQSGSRNQLQIVSLKNYKIEEKISSIIGCNDEEKLNSQLNVPVYSVERIINLQ